MADQVDYKGADKKAVDAILTFYKSKTSKDWKLTSVTNVAKHDTGTKIGLVMCSGDVCAMETFMVDKNNAVSKPVTPKKNSKFA